ncbi:MAG: polysaccharide biosynthesis tyrosine autokinase [Candidatus Coatesbacteria bacterium]
MSPQTIPPPQAPDTAPELSIDLWHLWRVIRRRRQIIGAVASLIVIVTAIAVLSMRAEYESKALVLIEKVGSNALERDGVSMDSTQDDYYQTQYAILQSRSLAQAVFDDLKLGLYREFQGGDAVGSLQKAHIRIEPVRRTRLVSIVGVSRDPKLAADIANSGARKFIEQNLENKLFLSKALLKSLDGKVPQSVKESLPAVVGSPLIQTLKGQLASLQGEWAELSSRYRPEHPRMQQLKARMTAVNGQIEREVDHIVESLKIQLGGEFKGSNVRIVDEARAPDWPTRPRRFRIMALAVLLGLAAGVGVGLIVDRWDLTVRTAEDVEGMIHVPCLGLIHLIGRLEWSETAAYDSIWRDGRSVTLEAYRNLRVAVNFRLAQVTGPKVLLVTSSIEDEGKTFVASNLARAFAAAGERVLLVDGDLRRPAVHRVFEVKVETGLSTYLSNGAGDPARIDSSVPNLTLLPCGPVPDNAAELLHDEKIVTLLEWATKRYDRVIVDSSPLFPIADALVWGRHTHGVILVVGAGQSRVYLIQRSVHRLRESFAHVLGIVLNKAQYESFGPYGYSAYYRRYYAASNEERLEAMAKSAAKTPPAPPVGGSSNS